VRNCQMAKNIRISSPHRSSVLVPCFIVSSATGTGCAPEGPSASLRAAKEVP
jgi:hypothetical protein